MKRITLYLQDLNDGMLTKDVVLIPFILEKHFGYKARILTVKPETEFPSIKKYLDNMEINFVRNDYETMEVLKNTDVLMVIGIYDWNVKIIDFYKKVRPNGKVYLKLDANITWISILYQALDDRIRKMFNDCDMISVESRKAKHIMNQLFGLNIKYIPNGYYDFFPSGYVDYNEKQNIILFVGRVGTGEKNNEMLLEAFKIIANQIPNWNIELVGNVEPTFNVYLDNYFKTNPHLKNRIKLIGFLDKKELKEEYKKAKIFCLTSPSEACANVFSQAVSNGCYLISTDVDGAIDIIDYGKYGAIVPVNNPEKLANTLLESCKDDNMLKLNCINAQRYAHSNLSWIVLCKEIDKNLF